MTSYLMAHKKQKIAIVIPSWNRAGNVSTLKLFPSATLYVAESQFDKYSEAHSKTTIVALPDSVEGNISRKRNAVLDRVESDRVLMLDDDITRLGYWENQKIRKPASGEIRRLVNMLFELAEQCGARMCGINQNSDGANYRIFKPFSFQAAILGPFMGFIVPDLRFDEKMDGKEDYDMFLQQLRIYRRTFRHNKWFYESNHGTRPGGINTYRTMEMEEDRARRLVERWGERVVRIGGSPGTGGGSILNVSVRSPLRGA